jgi:hypothetical protein
MKNERRKRDADYINVTTIYIHSFGCVCLKTGTWGRDSRDPTKVHISVFSGQKRKRSGSDGNRESSTSRPGTPALIPLIRR